MQPLPANSSKITVILFDADVETMKRRYGRGWTEQVRLLVQKNCADYRKHKRTIEDLILDGATDGQ